jgi:hypothetical protein
VLTPQVLGELPSGHARALLLACGDCRNLLASAGRSRPGLTALTAVLNDSNPVVLARAALLLLLVAEGADNALLWDVWHNALWPQGTWARVRPVLQQLLSSEVPWLQPARPEDQAALQAVWKWWLDDAGGGSIEPDELLSSR